MAVRWDETHQTIVGFGGTMGWIHPHPSKRKEIFDRLFTELGASLLRIQALGGEEGDESCLEPENDNDDPRTFNWSRFPIARTEAKNAIIIQAAQERGVKMVLAVPWSPPGWMKDTSRRAGGGQLKESMLDEFAELWAAYILGMRREFKIDIPAISIQNEPDLEYYYPTCRFEPGHCARAMAAVERRLRQEKLSVQVLGPDTCRIYNLPDYLDAMDKAKASPGTPALTHLYDLSIPFERVDRDPARWREAKALALRYRRGLWMVETANYLSWGTEAGSYDEALIWAQKIHHALVEGDCAVVCYWSLFFDKRGEALIYSPRSEAEEVEITPKFYTSMHYYRFVRPGMIRCTATPSVPGLLLSAFRKEKGGEGDRVIVMVHPGDEARSLRFEPGCTGRWDRYVTAATKSCVREAPVESGEMLELPARSVLTLVRSGPP